VTLCALWLCATACASGSPTRTGDPFSDRPTNVRLNVQNRNFNDATLYVIDDVSASGGRRLGIVGGNSSARFVLEWNFASDLSIRIDTLGGSCITPPLTVGPGEELNLEITPDFSQSAFCL
jgi:hypothetical protein